MISPIDPRICGDFFWRNFMALTPETFQNLEIDIEDTGKANNTDAIITPRYGPPFKSIPMVSRLGEEGFTAAIQKIENVGGYISAPNLSVLNAIMPLYNYQLARVEDTGDEYRWDPAVTPTPKWVSTGRNIKNDITLVANDAAKQQIATVAFFLGNNGVLHGFRDSAGNVYEFTDVNGGKYLPGLENSVQMEILGIKEKTGLLGISDRGTLYEFKDIEGNLIGYIDQNSEFFFTGLEHSIQYYLLNMGQINKAFTAPKTYKTAADFLSLEVSHILNSNEVKAPVAEGLLAQNYHVNDSLINNLTMPVSNQYIQIGAYNDKGTKTNWVADSGVVHPNIIKFEKPLNGYKYWLGLNPYTSNIEDYELPYIYGSNSGNFDDWELIPNITQPFDTDPPDSDGATSGHLSDSFFTYDPINGELWFCWRQTRYYNGNRDRNTAKQTFFGKNTKDGVSWSEKKVILPEYTIGDNLRLSPAIAFNAKDGLFYMYAATLSGSITVEVSQSLENPNWKLVKVIEVNFIAYHLEAKFLGDQLFLLVHSDSRDQLYVGVTDDMQNFKWQESNKGLFDTTLHLYKSTFLPLFTDDEKLSLIVLYTSDQAGTPSWRLYKTQTNFVSIN